MTRQVTGVFSSQEQVLEAVGLFHSIGYSASHLLVLAKRRIPSRKLHDQAGQPKLGKRADLLEAIFWGALIGGLIFEAIGAVAAFLIVEDVPVRWFIIAWVWKFGAFLGGFIGTFVFEGRGPNVHPGEEYKAHFASGVYVLAVTAEERDVSSVRGILIESGGHDVQDVTSGLLVVDGADGPDATGAPSPETRHES